MSNSTNQRPQGSYISHFSNMVKAHGGINLAQGIPGYQPPAALLDALQARLRDDVHQYAPGQGNRQLLQLVAQRYGLQPNNVLMVQGGTEGLSLVYTYIAQRVEADMAVMAIEPAYEVHSNLPRIYGHRYVAFCPNPDGSLDLGRLERTVAEQSVRLLFVASPGNPYGRALSRTEVEQLLQIAVRQDFYLVFDAAYHELYFGPNASYLPIDSMSERLFVVGSFSKSLCITGWRVGYVLHHASHGDTRCARLCGALRLVGDAMRPGRLSPPGRCRPFCGHHASKTIAHPYGHGQCVAAARLCCSASRWRLLCVGAVAPAHRCRRIWISHRALSPSAGCHCARRAFWSGAYTLDTP